MMKISYISLVIFAIAGVVLSSCASQKETVVQSTGPTNKTIHTQEELQKTGQSETGPALEKVDPSIQTSGRP